MPLCAPGIDIMEMTERGLGSHQATTTSGRLGAQYRASNLFPLDGSCVDPWGVCWKVSWISWSFSRLPVERGRPQTYVRADTGACEVGAVALVVPAATVGDACCIFGASLASGP